MQNIQRHWIQKSSKVQWSFCCFLLLLLPATGLPLEGCWHHRLLSPVDVWYECQSNESWEINAKFCLLVRWRGGPMDGDIIPLCEEVTGFNPKCAGHPVQASWSKTSGPYQFTYCKLFSISVQLNVIHYGLALSWGCYCFSVQPDSSFIDAFFASVCASTIRKSLQ